MSSTHDKLLTTEEVAEWLAIAPRQVGRFGIPQANLGHKTKRYRRADVEAWLQSRTTNNGKKGGRHARTR